MQEATKLDCREALERLIAREPSVADDSQVAQILLEDRREEDDVLTAVQALLLKPQFTVAVAGCFRPLLLRLVNGLVQSYRNSWYQGGGQRSIAEEDHDPGIPGIANLQLSDFSINWSLSSRENAVVAFSWLLELAPHILGTLLEYFSFAPPPFERFLLPSGHLSKSAPALLDLVRACYRYLHLKPETFRGLWDWSPILDLLQWTSREQDLEQGSQSQSQLQTQIVCDLRWCAVQIISIVLKMSDSTTRALSSTISNVKDEAYFACLSRWEACSDKISVEKAGAYLRNPVHDCSVANDAEKIDSLGGKPSLLLDNVQSVVRWRSAGASFVEICGVQLPIKMDGRKSGTAVSRTGSFVLTPTVQYNLESVVLALSQRQPIVLEGPVGAGKSSLIKELANVTGNSDVIFIHLDDQMDSKTLLGNYVCTEIPGEFKWQPGALTQAVVQGKWVVFEDIDKAPLEILSALVPLLEDRKLYIAGRGEVIHAADNFLLFSTVTHTKSGPALKASSGKDVLTNLWRKVIIEAPSNEELAIIIAARFPMLSTLIPKLIGTLNMVRDIASRSARSEGVYGTLSTHIGRQFSTRDLIKWCRRIIVLGGQCFENTHLSSYVREQIYVEAVDCFAGSISNIADRQLVMRAIAEQWEIPLERVDFFCNMNKPSVQVTRSSVQVGRATVPLPTHQGRKPKPLPTEVFASTGHAMRMLEIIGACIQQKEAILLVGETGTGKTSLVQHLARQVSMPLVVLNLSQQSDSVDFLGGYKPVEAQSVCIPLFETYSNLFRETFSTRKNTALLEQLGRLVGKKKWDKLLKSFRSTVETVAKLVGSSSYALEGHTAVGASNGSLSESTTSGRSSVGEGHSSKRQRQLDNRTIEAWRTFSVDLHKAERQVESAKTAFAFSFVEGALVKAMKAGHWILLDEVNLAPTETLERLTGVLEGEEGSLLLAERGDVENIQWHPDFRIFACMNPATDVGKRILPMSLRNRFTEFFVDELTNMEDLRTLVYQYLEAALPSPPVDDIVNFYLLARHEADVRLLDGANQKPRYSLRSLVRALDYTKEAMPTYGFQRALYDGICMSFLTLLDRPSSLVMEQLILKLLFKQKGTSTANKSKVLSSLLKRPPQPTPRHVLFEQFWVESGEEARSPDESDSALEICKRYVLTPSIREHLKNLARAVFVRKNPVLLQGPTSSGKTSMIEYLAVKTGHHFVRINNHEHTDLQEYLGSYVSDKDGKLAFQEGLLVQAVRKGHWIVLDELNLAPSDVLEALNRLLDDNRELFVPELQTMIKPHPHFMLFATQNPPGVYGGRKVLSRAFRNRFVELHVDDIPDDELQEILEQRCQIPGSYARKMVEVMKDLQRHRQGSKVFAGKHGFITPRDLFRWAERRGNGYEELAWDGYMLLAERLRNPEEKAVVQQTLEKHMRVKIHPDQLHEMSSSNKVKEIQEHLLSSASASLGNIVWTKSMTRLFNLVEHCVRHKEPPLLVGDTGCGKTTVCQMMALLLNRKLHILNCHQHSETADFIGGLRPIRDRDTIATKYAGTIRNLVASGLLCGFYDGELSSRIEDSALTISLIQRALSQCRSHKKKSRHESGPQLSSEVADATAAAEEERIESELLHLQREYQSLFFWQDGPLVTAMREGDLFLIDEISLSDDSVLERLNSILDPKRVLVLAEKGGSNVEELIAHENFLVLATMNPGGDFGKRELSPALRNRFTEIWVPPINDLDDLQRIVADRFSGPELVSLKDPLLQFWQWFQRQGEQGRLLSVRDLLSWVNFINITSADVGASSAFIHGAFLVLLDGIGLGSGLPNAAAQQMRSRCLEHLLELLPENARTEFRRSFSPEGQISNSRKLEAGGGQSISSSTEGIERNLRSSASALQTQPFGIHPFYIPRGNQAVEKMTFELAAPTTCWNVLRLLRAMQLSKPVLLEGSPGVGKTSLVSAVALGSCHPLVRINLSEQTDVVDLFGSDMPVEGGKSGEYCWSDGVFLQALKAGHWVLLDELNLASQSVLEGLNACLDHRGEVFIPELGRAFKCPKSFRVFACQNPLSQGGGRKGLPKSFLNRFTKVYVDALGEDDLLFIAQALHPSISKSTLKRMVHFNMRLFEDTMIAHTYGHLGAPWEFNLRDILRWCELLEGIGSDKDQWSEKRALECAFDVVYLQRMRTKEDRHHVLGLYNEIFGACAKMVTHSIVTVSPEYLSVGLAKLSRKRGTQLQRDTFKQIQLLPGFGHGLEALMHCVRQGWMCSVVGPAASGKTSLVRTLAALTGNTLHEFAISTATDTTELLGCFEQHDPFRHWQDLVKSVDSSIASACSFCLITSDTDTTKVEMGVDRKLELVRNLLSSWAAFQKCLVVGSSRFNHNQSMPTSWITSNDWEGRGGGDLDPTAVEMLLQTVEHLGKLCDDCGIMSDELELGLDATSKPGYLLGGLKALKESLNLGQEGQTLGRFEWVDGGLLRAIERGDWVLLENANFCNPTVLDRLNPLLEPDGTILVNERGLVRGESMIVRPHPNFRLFLTVDPTHGEVSRAMRNRGIEIFMIPPDRTLPLPSPPSQFEEVIDLQQQMHHGNDYTPIQNQDEYKLLVHAGIPSQSLTKAMYTAHNDMRFLTESLPGGGGAGGGGMMHHHVSLRDMSLWISLLQQLLHRGCDLSWSLACSWTQTYVRHLDDVKAKEAALHIFRTRVVAGLNLSTSPSEKGWGWDGRCLYLPGGWPHPHTLELYCISSTEACVKRDAMYLEFLAAQFFALRASKEWHLIIKGRGVYKERMQNAWLDCKKGTLPYFPATLLQSFLNPALKDIRREQATTGSESTPLHITAEQGDDDDAAAKLQYAALWMVERGTLSDIGLRMQLLEQCAARVTDGGSGGSCQTILSNIVSVIRNELDHALSKQLSAAWAHLEVTSGRSFVGGAVPYASPGMLSSFKDNDVEEEEDNEKNGLKDAWNDVVLLGEKILALRKSLFQWQLEDEAYKSAMLSWGTVTGPLSTASPVLQSYIYCRNKKDLRMHRLSMQQQQKIPELVLECTYRLFMAMRELENGVLLVASSHLWETGVGKSLAELQKWHVAFWRVLSQPVFNFENCLFHWVHAKRSLLEMIEFMGDAKVVVDLRAILCKLDKGFGTGESSAPKPLLWKHGGHPQLLSSKELNEQEMQITTLCNSLWDEVDQNREKLLPIRTDAELRRVVMEGISMSIWLRHKNLKKSEDDNHLSPPSISMHEALHECGEIFKMLLQQLHLRESRSTGFITEQQQQQDAIPFFKEMRGESRLQKQKSRLTGCRCIDPHPHQNEELVLRDLMHLAAVQEFWSELLVWIDHVSLSLDITLLSKASSVTVLQLADVHGDVSLSFQRQGLDFESLKSTLEYSLTSSSRSPLDFVPHQHILWIIDPAPSRTSDVMVLPKDIVQEMWFRWHQAIWRKGSSTPLEGPARFFQAVQSVILSNNIRRKRAVKDYLVGLAQLRVSAMHIYNLQQQQSFPNVNVTFLNLRSCSALFLQMVLAHKKAFSVEVFPQIQHRLCALQDGVAMIHMDNYEQQQRSDLALMELEPLLRCSQHEGLNTILDALVLPCAALLYCTTWTVLSTSDALLQLARVWLFIGLIRLTLILPVDGCDPVSKYGYKHELASDELANLKLEMEVRRRSEVTAGGAGTSPELIAMQSRADKMEQELSALSFQIVPRPQPPRFVQLCQNVHRFVERFAGIERLTSLLAKLSGREEESLKAVDLASAIAEAVAWQEHAENFIHHLVKEFSAYKDFVQPIQHAVYELKFGLSLTTAAHAQLQELHSDGVKIDEKALTDLVCLLMEFPSCCSHEVLSFDGRSIKQTRSSTAAAVLLNDVTDRMISWASSLEKSSAVPPEVTKMKIKAAVLQIALMTVVQEMLQSSLITKMNLNLLNFISSSLSSLWSKIREFREEKRNEENVFKVSTFSMDVEPTLDEETFKAMFPNYKSDFDDGFIDDESSTRTRHADEDDRRAQRAIEEAQAPVNEDIALLEKAWVKMEEEVLQTVTRMHQRIFAASAFDCLNQEQTSFRGPSDEERVERFGLSYDTGRQLIQVVGRCIPSSVDEQLLPAHLMRLSLEYQSLGGGGGGGSSMEESLAKGDIYTDPQPSEIALMLDPVGGLLRRITMILQEWPEHPILQQLQQICWKLLSLPLDTVIMKALTGVELLLSKAQLWEQNAANHVSVTVELDHLSRLVTRWRKMELNGWSTMLKKAEQKHTLSAKRLWFPFYGLLHRHPEDDLEGYFESTISSIEEFMQTATFGEYRTRLELVRAFYGQFSVQSRIPAPPEGLTREIVARLSNILYNVFNYYRQFLPMLDEIVASEKGAIETELKEFVRLSKWDDRSHYTLTLSAEKSHRKLHKLVKKYDVLLKRSVNELLTKQASRMGTQNMSSMASTPAIGGSNKDSPSASSDPLHVEPIFGSSRKTKRIEEKTSKSKAFRLPPEEWQKRCDRKLLKLANLTNSVSEGYPSAGKYHSRLLSLTAKMGALLGTAIFSEASSNFRLQGSESLQTFSTSIIGRSMELRNDEQRVLVKKKAMVDLLRALRQIGLSHHRSAVPKEQRNVKSWLQLQPAEVEVEVEVAEGMESSVKEGQNYVDMECNSSLWTKASNYYYKNMALLQRLQRSGLAFNKDLSLREVEFMSGYTEHLLYLQQRQRSRAQEFSSKLCLLGQLVQVLSSCGKGDAALPRQGFMEKWMWLQKVFVDSLHKAVTEASLLFKSSENVQLCSANPMRINTAAVKDILRELLVAVDECKIRLDSHIVPKGHWTEAESKEASWPLLYTSPMLDDLSANFAFLSSTRATFPKLFEGIVFSGLDNLRQLLFKGHAMFEEFEMERFQDDQMEEASGLSELSWQFTQLYEKIVSEALVEVQKVGKTQAAGARNLQSEFNDVEEITREEEALELEGTLHSYESAIMDQVLSLRVTPICEDVIKVLSVVGKLLNNHAKENALAVDLGKLLNNIHVPLELIHGAGKRLLSDYISLHNAVTKLGYVLSNLFVSLCTEGFCIAREQEGQDSTSKSEDASGTGMGEGEGKTDISEQIEDEEQLMGGGTEKEEDLQQSDAGKKADKGIEMEQDFSGDMIDLSDDEHEDEDEDGNDQEEEENIESKMGEQEDDDTEVVDEKLWDDEDDKMDREPNAKEKYEKDSGVSGAKPEDIEMRGKEEDEDEDKEKDEEDLGKNKQDKEKLPSKNEVEDQSESPEGENTDNDGNQEKNSQGVEEKSGVEPSMEESLDIPENLDLDGKEKDEKEQEQEQEQHEDSRSDAEEEKQGKEAIDDAKPSEAMNMDTDESQEADEARESEPNQGDNASGEGENEEGSSEMDIDNLPQPAIGADVEDEEEAEAEASPSKRDVDDPAQDNVMEDPEEHRDGQSDSQNADDSVRSSAAKPSEQQTSVISGIRGSTASRSDDAQDNEEERGMTDWQQERPEGDREQQALLQSGGGADKTSFSEPPMTTTDTRNMENPNLNPYRSLGDALKQWKERVRVVDDTMEAPSSAVDNNAEEDPLENENPPASQPEEENGAAEYKFVAAEEQNTAQALGSATREQLEESKELKSRQTDPGEPDSIQPEADPSDIKKDEENSRVAEETQIHSTQIKNKSENGKTDAKDRKRDDSHGNFDEDTIMLDGEDDDRSEPVNGESMISLQRRHHPQDLFPQSTPSPQYWTDDDISRVRKELESGLMQTAGNRETAVMVWQKYDHLTARLSQELAEQLRLILEPTLATKLQGDYRTGKRINMKKIIPYIASSFRKDKIWLRRTKANKRQYQVVLAIDDSRSMSESHCGHMAVEALITICKAMSQLEIGQMAVASFGQKGNVHLLHDFDQPFSTESGINMMCQFSFNQDNTIADQPMADLLQFLTRILDIAANTSAAPSGTIDLQQLVLIIADGRFHEKESLRRCIREATSRRQLLAFIVLDNPQESIIDMQSVSFVNGAPLFAKYLDTFPFPYYILLRDIESLPRVLADLMRQWFELTQGSTSGQ